MVPRPLIRRRRHWLALLSVLAPFTSIELQEPVLQVLRYGGGAPPVAQISHSGNPSLWVISATLLASLTPSSSASPMNQVGSCPQQMRGRRKHKWTSQSKQKADPSLGYLVHRRPVMIYIDTLPSWVTVTWSGACNCRIPIIAPPHTRFYIMYHQ